MEIVSEIIFWRGSKISADGDCLLFGKIVMKNLDKCIKKQDITLPTKVHTVKIIIFPVVMYGCGVGVQRPNAEELMLPTLVLEKTLESPSDSKIKPVNPKGNQSSIFIGRTGNEAEVSILWPPNAKN